MTTNVTGIFNTRMEAERAVNELLSAGFDKDDISLVLSDKARNQFAGSDKEKVDTAVGDENTRAAKGGATGAAVGGVLGALIAGLTVVGSIAIPGAGLLVAGPLVGILSGAGAGAAVGGLSGALIKAGYPNDEATRYEDEIKAGKALVIVKTDNADEATRARTAMNVTGASMGTIKAA